MAPIEHKFAEPSAADIMPQPSNTKHSSTRFTVLGADVEMHQDNPLPV